MIWIAWLIRLATSHAGLCMGERLKKDGVRGEDVYLPEDLAETGQDWEAFLSRHY
ncbi:hypothetical protein PHLCEN_2v3107 [Hermanssonia centrifuga]|uniref:Uncharacterized protein n=1 Tax=Hermanssonia centrifuga TaxID=98765 RepID=A0A2R6R3V7_9APHY|nr:hypothetical protein PHLCEN_2v3107 [Hermanssonia centrifuga]